MLRTSNDTAINIEATPSSPTSPKPTTTITTQPSPPPSPLNITIEPITTATIPSYRRLITTLLPIRYQEKYYAESVADPTSSSLALCALYHDPHLPSTSKATSSESTGEVVAGIQCHLEPILSPTANATASVIPKSVRHPPVSPPLAAQSPHQNLYISTLCTLSPHRSRGVATALLNHIIYTLLTHPAYAKYTIETLYAHVWEANEEALEWYQRRGFTVEKRVVEGYYRKLRPMGGRIVRRGIVVGDYIRVKGAGWED